MIIIGELINGSRKEIAQAIGNRDADYIKQLAIQQVEAGAAFIDCNPGTVGDQEVADMQWLVETVQEATDKPISFDSPNPEAIQRAIDVYAGEVQPMINSITLETERLEAMLPLVKQAPSNVIALAMGDEGMPSQPGQREEVARQLIDLLTDAGLEPTQIFVDVLIAPVSAEPQAGQLALQAMAAIRQYCPDCHITAGLSNISYGLPNRRLLNRVFLVMAMQAGMDSAIMDPLDEKIMAQIMAAEALLGQDEFCMKYLQTYRAGRLNR